MKTSLPKAARQRDTGSRGVATSAQLDQVEASLKTCIANLETRSTNQTWKIVLVGVGLVSGMIAYATSLVLSAVAG